ncbi:hypothetical protein MTO96_015191 [Rhipicephalus appendiculatus]
MASLSDKKSAKVVCVVSTAQQADYRRTEELCVELWRALDEMQQKQSTNQRFDELYQAAYAMVAWNERGAPLPRTVRSRDGAPHQQSTRPHVGYSGRRLLADAHSYLGRPPEERENDQRYRKVSGPSIRAAVQHPQREQSGRASLSR